jgi:hypothetical protein
MDDIIILLFDIIVLLFLWNIAGMAIWSVVRDVSAKIRCCKLLFEWINPIWIYRNYKVNFFGTIMVCALYNLIFPIGSICYWFYKLCTVGRKASKIK